MAEGLDNMWAVMASLEPERVVKAIRKSLRATGKLVAEHASLGSPVDTGLMRDSWISRMKDGDQVFIRNKVKYVRHVPHATGSARIEIAEGAPRLLEDVQKELLRDVKKKRARRTRKSKPATPARG